MTDAEKRAQTEKAREAAAEWRLLHPALASSKATKAAKERWKGHKKKRR
jgi:hypothetical protein